MLLSFDELELRWPARGFPLSKRIVIFAAAERLRQHAIEPLLSRIAELLDADRHALVAGCRLIPVGAEQAIPPRQIEAEVRVGLADHDGVVHAVHVRRDDQPSQHAVDPRRQPHVGVIEHRSCVEEDLEDQHRYRRRAKRRNDGELDHHRQHDLDRMKPRSRRHIELEIGVVHAMQPPKGWHRMEEHMLEIDDEIEHDHRDGHGSP